MITVIHCLTCYIAKILYNPYCSESQILLNIEHAIAQCGRGICAQDYTVCFRINKSEKARHSIGSFAARYSSYCSKRTGYSGLNFKRYCTLQFHGGVGRFDASKWQMLSSAERAPSY
jgi:hypothetical protein